MYISEIEIKNIRCFDHLNIKLEKEGSAVLWTMVVGDNAAGKSCLLRCIAIGLCDQASAAGLIKELEGSFIRDNTNNVSKIEGSIKITLRDKDKAEHTIKTIITRESKDLPESVSQVVETPHSFFPWQEILVCGYGPYRAFQSYNMHSEYEIIEAVLSLFNYETQLQNPEVILLRQKEENREIIQKKLLEVLMLDEGQIVHSEKGMQIKGPWGVQPYATLSDGYKSTTNWFLDFFYWHALAGNIETNKMDHLTGILLIDELETHLHPKWQREIVDLLRKQFPKVQFITTTHSPLVVPDIGSLIKIERKEMLLHLSLIDSVSVAQEIDLKKGMTIDQVLASDAFDYLIDSDPEVEGLLAEASRLAGKGKERNKKEDEWYQTVKDSLAQIYYPEGQSRIQQEIETERENRIIDEVKMLEEKLFGKNND